MEENRLKDKRGLTNKDYKIVEERLKTMPEEMKFGVISKEENVLGCRKHFELEKQQTLKDELELLKRIKKEIPIYETKRGFCYYKNVKELVLIINNRIVQIEKELGVGE